MQAQHPGVSAVVAWGGGVKYRKLAGDDWVVHRRLRGAAQVQTVVDAIAALHDDDPARPVCVFGYLTIARGLSVRTSTRVVTHLTAWFSDGRNIECVLQAIGRAYGDCKAALAALGFDGVVVLTRGVDFDSAMSHPRFMRDLVDAMAAGDSLAAAWRAEYGAGCDFMSRQRRSLGPKRLRLALECTFVEGAAEGRGLTADRMAAAEALARAGMDADAALVCLVAQSLMKAHKVSVIAVDPAFLEAGRKELAWPVVFPRDGLATVRAAVAAMADAGRAPFARRAAAFSSCLDGTMVVEAALLDDDTNSVCIMDPRRLGRSPDAEDKLLRLALSGAEQFNSTQSLARFLETHRLGPKNLPGKALARFQRDLAAFRDAFPQLFAELTEDVEERWTRERLVRVCRAARVAASPDAALGADDLVVADAFFPPSRRALAFRTLPLMVGLGADGRRLPCGLPDAAAGGGGAGAPAEFVLALHALQALRRRSAPAAAARAPGSASKKRRGGSAPLPAAPVDPVARRAAIEGGLARDSLFSQRVRDLVRQSCRDGGVESLTWSWPQLRRAGFADRQHKLLGGGHCAQSWGGPVFETVGETGQLRFHGDVIDALRGLLASGGLRRVLD
ncbi:hypothetical protein JKP88DRAFT_279186 [Tribonema minus]|uniref:Uncharacterized protein n=1 Tax=Tribonema minus TaxID=303371 RepID=A0A836CEJ7_9STRA|nr:hypothetical protein JKP88DRAFT_279186 [Tribonema minus]